MKKLILLILILIASVQAFAQLEVKPGSFHEVPGFVNINPDDNYQLDDNDLPFAVIKVRTENITDKQRRDLRFESNMAVFIMLEYKTGEVWVYLTAKYADYLKISHPDFSSIEFTIPFDLQPKKGYEMTLVNNTAPPTSGSGSLTITTKPENGASVTLNGKLLNRKTPYTNDMIAAGQYEITVQKERYKSVTKTISIQDGDNQAVEIEMPIDVATITINVDAQTDVYVDGNFVKRGTWSGELYSGEHAVVCKKQFYNDAMQIIKVKAGKPEIYSMNLNPIYGKISIISEPSGASVYIDGKKRGNTPIYIENVIIGQHQLRIEKTDCAPISKSITLDEVNELRLVEKLETGKTLPIFTDKIGDMVFVDEIYLGLTPLNANMSFGEHEVTVVRGSKDNTIVDLNTLQSVDGVKTETKKINVMIKGGIESVQMAFAVGAGNGVFSVSPYKKVMISSGNLQYRPSTNTWRFAEHQWDVIGEGNKDISSNSDWIDMFGWGTSGFNGKNPYMTSNENSDYYGGVDNISGSNYDWGSNNISNGVGKKWYTLTKDEWQYLLWRKTKSGVSYAKAVVNGVNGLILLPDNWSVMDYKLNKTNDSDAHYNSNIITQTDWTERLEIYGAIFLPAGGNRIGTTLNNVGLEGFYWSSERYTNASEKYFSGDDKLLKAFYFYFTNSNCVTDYNVALKIGQSVRLVRDAQ